MHNGLRICDGLINDIIGIILSIVNSGVTVGLSSSRDTINNTLGLLQSRCGSRYLLSSRNVTLTSLQGVRNPRRCLADLVIL